MRYAALILALLPVAAGADALPPGLVSAELRPGWVMADGTRMVALDLRLEPGWKTYWRSPGDAGIPPEFDWSASGNVADGTAHWPAPQVIDSGGMESLGYHDRLVLPITLTATDAAAPLDPAVTVDLGLCLDICVPAHLSLRAGAPGDAPDPQILTALDRVPSPDPAQAQCASTEISDGMRLTATLPGDFAAYHAAAMELPGLWVSPAEITRDGDAVRISADVIDQTGLPFALDPREMRLTLLSPDRNIELTGCLD